ncbi:MAG: UDP-N-acetylglucosamine 2-epimerase (non-hydrolyzing) [Verrucomicrobia bacterium]|nr:UDP-N-acetylglucosamine 2-epimerase (non-hydrolyzing) [Verrucomicrobiota bacterium]
MHRPKILSIVGTRPEAIKMAPVILELQRAVGRFEHVLVSTAQHRQMLDPVFRAFHLGPALDLNLMQPNQGLADFTARALTTLAHVFAEEAPDAILVQGDTTTVMTAALAAFYQRIPVGHIEAGLRTFDRHQPFPEEVNRRFVSAVGDWHFAPTDRARTNLLREGVPPQFVFVTGNTIVDALRLLPVEGDFETVALRRLPLHGRRLVLVTAHRRENHGAPLQGICQAVRALTEAFPDVAVIYPVHLNPNVQSVVRAELGRCPRVHLTEPLAYPDLLRLMARSHLILTDSGGIQEEAPSFHRPVLILRETTERPEIIEVGAGRLVGTAPNRIVAEAGRLLSDPAEYVRMSHARNPFGDGHAARRIVEILGRVMGQAAPVSNAPCAEATPAAA